MADPGPGFIVVYARFTNTVGHECQNSCGYATDGPLDQATVDDISAQLSVNYKPQLSTSSVFHGIHVLEGNDGGPLAWDSATGAGAGTFVGELCPPNVQGLLKKVTGHAGRRGRGRMYIPDIAEAAIGDSGLVTGSQLTRLTDIANGWINVPTNVGEPISNTVLMHDDGGTPYNITAITAELMVATQRRRFPRS